MQNQKGVTLIALIITIIVMLILVVVTINIATSGEIVNKTIEAKTQTQAATQNELNQMNTTSNGISEAVASATTEGTVYEISTVEQLEWVANQVNTGANLFEGETIILTADINFEMQWNESGEITTGTAWTPIGYYTEELNRVFKGTFNGNNKTISNIYIADDNLIHVGLIGMALNSNIINLTIKDSYVKGQQVGAIVGASANSTISGCINDNTKVTTGESGIAGGIVGIAAGNCMVNNCNNSGDITATNYAAGIVGVSDDIFATGINNVIGQNCSNSGIITAATTDSIYNIASLSN